MLTLDAIPADATGEPDTATAWHLKILTYVIQKPSPDMSRDVGELAQAYSKHS